MTRRHVIELYGGPGDGRRYDATACPTGTVLVDTLTAERYVWDGQPAVLLPDDTAVRRFTHQKEATDA